MLLEETHLRDLEKSRSPESVSIPCEDGSVLSGQLFLPPCAPKVAIVFHGATGVRQDFYAAFAEWLSRERNAAVLTYDYRDYGASATGPIKHAKATMAQWGVEDQSAALDYLCQRFPELPLEGIGHSIGGLFLAFHRKAHKMQRFTAIASGPAYWKRHPLTFMPSVIAFWFVVGPLLTKVLGYLPGRLIGLGADVPAGVYWQWRRWCITPHFHRQDWGEVLPMPDPASVQCQLSLVAISDDPMIPPDTVSRLATFYPMANTEYRIISPADAGTKAIGHIRVFSESCRTAWPKLIG